MNGIDYVLEDANSYDWGFVGIFYRASYAYKGKYLAELSGRYDGARNSRATNAGASSRRPPWAGGCRRRTL